MRKIMIEEARNGGFIVQEVGQCQFEFLAACTDAKALLEWLYAWATKTTGICTAEAKTQPGNIDCEAQAKKADDWAKRYGAGGTVDQIEAAKLQNRLCKLHDTIHSNKPSIADELPVYREM